MNKFVNILKNCKDKMMQKIILCKFRYKTMQKRLAFSAVYPSASSAILSEGIISTPFLFICAILYMTAATFSA